MQHSSSFSRRRLATVIHSILLLGSGSALAASNVDQVEFNPAFFPSDTGSGKFDVTRFNRGNVVLPGTYRSEVYVNGTWVGREVLAFAAVDGEDSAQLCMERNLLIRFGIDIDGVGQKAAQAGEAVPPAFPPTQVCGDIGKYVPGAVAEFNSGEGKLELQVPQIYMAHKARGYVSPEHWATGMNAGFVRYNANAYANSTNGQASNSGYLGLNAGLNLGDWNFRHNGSYSSNSYSSGYQSSATYVQRGFSGIQSQLMAGQIYTTGEFFDSIRLRGVTLATDDRMMPDSLTGFAPIVRGVAETNAKVTVRQRGMLIDEVSVAPGPFVLEDLFPTGYGGDLEVTVTEADGRQRKFIVPFASNANLLRPGYSRYSFSVGSMEELGISSNPWLMQGTYQRGFSNLLTGYTGATVAEGYYSPLIGVAFNTPVGALSFDLTASRTDVPGLGSLQGQSVQVRYNKNFAETGTNFALGAFRYSTDGFLGARDAAQLREVATNGGDLTDVGRLRERFDISISQSLPSGSVFLTGSSQQYWNRQSSTVDFTAGYSGSWGQVNYTITAQRSLDLISDQTRNQIDLTFSLPIGDSPRSPTLSTTLSRNDKQGSARAGLSGMAGERNQINYGVSTSYAQATDTGPSNSSSDANLTYRGQYAQTSGSFSQGNGYRSTSLGATGGVVIHPGGVTFAPEMGDTFGLVHAPGAEGAWVGSGGNSQIGSNGYAVIPYLTPYRSNSVELDPKGMSHDVELKTASQNVAPPAGSVVMLNFDTSTGRALLINAVRADGNPVPYGADVFDELGTSVGVAGQAGKMFVRVAQTKGELTVRWSEERGGMCRIPFDLGTAVAPAHTTLPQVSGLCKG
ncbi:fimbria/pilus outer membrane usher protein [Pseudomonas sp. O11]|uniref:fimbria/pilus outer membrane usher protein n=1 Tax=Pseudomonas sp. O11 TaxID=3159446 RepID=UPI00387AC0C0